MAPTRDDNARDKRERPPPEPSDILKRCCALYDVEIRYYKKMEHTILAKIAK